MKKLNLLKTSIGLILISGFFSFVQADNRVVTYATTTGRTSVATVLDTDGTLAGDSDARVATQKAVKTYVNTYGTPSGIIVMWSGTVATIPTGWVLCDGNYGTPDLRDRFIVGATQDSGGVAKTNVTGSLTQSGNGSIPQHSHGITGLSVANESEHTHTVPAIADGSGSVRAMSQIANSATSLATSAGSAHTHALSGSIDNYGTGSTNIAVYYALAFIMKS